MENFDKELWEEFGWEDLEEAKRWYDAGWRDADMALEWVGAGWEDPKEAERWYKAFAEWLYGGNFITNARMDVDERRASVSKIALHILPKMAMAWKEAGFEDPEKVINWLEEKYRYDGGAVLLRDIIKSGEEGLKPGKEDVWYINGWDEHHALISSWINAGWEDPKEAKRWFKAGWDNPVIAFEWHKTGLWKDAEEKELRMANRALRILGVTDPYEARKVVDGMLKKEERMQARRMRPGR